MPQIEDIAFSSTNYPYSDSFMSTGLTQNGRKFDYVSDFVVGNDYQKVWNVKLLEGRWFLPEDAVGKDKVVIINETLKNQMFGSQNASGKLIGDYDDKNKLKVIGVIADVKTNGDFQPGGKSYV